MSVLDLLAAYRRRERSPVEVTQAALERAEAVDRELRAFVTLTPELALQQAAAAERAYAEGTAGPLAGVPMTIKDLLDVAGVRTSMGSLLDGDRMAERDAPLVAIARAAGVAIIGKTATPENGWKGETSSRVRGSTLNPWRPTQAAGGSSGGAAVAAAMLPDALHQGGDGAGSIRIPASMCGVFGLKPTWGLVPTDVVNSGLSVQGPISRHVDESALLLDVLTGAGASAGLGEGIEGLRVAWSRDLGFAAVEPEVAAVCEAAAGSFAALGARLEEAHPPLDDPWPILDAIWRSNQAAPFAAGRLDEVRDLLDPGRVAVIERGLAMPATDLVAAQAAKARYAEAWDAFMADHDLLLTPTLPVTAFAAGLDQPGSVAGRATEYLSWTAFTYPFNVSGQPAATVPCGSVDGLPAGLQIVGRRGADALVLRAAAAFEAAHPWRFPEAELREAARYHPAMLDTVTVRPAELEDIPWMQIIEIAAGRLFAGIGMHDVAEDGAHETDVLARYVAANRAWVAERAGAICAYALADVLDGGAHLEQVTVHPDHGRRRIGSRLIDAVAAWACDQGFGSLTLLTFSDVAWNGPYYRRLGFVDLPDSALGPELATLREHEAELGLDVSIRGAMRLALP